LLNEASTGHTHQPFGAHYMWWWLLVYTLVITVLYCWPTGNKCYLGSLGLHRPNHNPNNRLSAFHRLFTELTRMWCHSSWHHNHTHWARLLHVVIHQCSFHLASTIVVNSLWLIERSRKSGPTEMIIQTLHLCANIEWSALQNRMELACKTTRTLDGRSLAPMAQALGSLA